MLDYMPFAILLLFAVAGGYLGFVVWMDYRRRRVELERELALKSELKPDQARSD